MEEDFWLKNKFWLTIQFSGYNKIIILKKYMNTNSSGKQSGDKGRLQGKAMKQLNWVTCLFPRPVTKILFVFVVVLLKENKTINGFMKSSCLEKNPAGWMMLLKDTFKVYLLTILKGGEKLFFPPSIPFWVKTTNKNMEYQQNCTSVHVPGSVFE